MGATFFLVLLLLGSVGLFSGCSNKSDESTEETNTAKSKAPSGSPPPDEKPRAGEKVDEDPQKDPYSYSEEEEAALLNQVTEGARLFCTGCPSDKTEDRLIRLPRDEILPNKELEYYYEGKPEESGFSAYVLHSVPAPSNVPIPVFDNAWHRQKKNEKRLMNAKDSRPDINIPRFTKCEIPGKVSAMTNSGENWKDGDGYCPMPIPEDAVWLEVQDDAAVLTGRALLFPRSFLICQNEGVIGLLDSGQIDEDTGLNLSDEYIQWLITAEGLKLYPYGDKADSDSAKARKNVTLGVGFTFDETGRNWDILEQKLGWTTEEIKSIVDGVYNGKDYSNSEEFQIDEDQAIDMFKEVAEREYIPNLNKAIAEIDSRNGKQTYSQQELEAMFDYSYNNGLTPTEDTESRYSSSIDDKDMIIYYYLRKDREGAGEAVRKFGNGTRRRVNQMNLFFNENYNFVDTNGDELNPLRKEFGIID